jgi:uncharacterized membrane protein
MSDHSSGPRGRKKGPLDGPLIKPQKRGMGSRLRSDLIAGVVVAAPIGITIALIYWAITGPMRKLDSFVKHALPAGDGRIDAITQAIPGLGVIIALILLVALGAFARNFAGRALIRFGERLVDSMPIVRNLYRFFKNVFETALRQSGRSFKEVVLIEYPRREIWTLAFVVGEAHGEVAVEAGGADEVILNLFVPTVPNPTSGFLLFLPKRECKPMAMTVEDAAKLVFSLGLVMPGDSPSTPVSITPTPAPANA